VYGHLVASLIKDVLWNQTTRTEFSHTLVRPAFDDQCAKVGAEDGVDLVCGSSVEIDSVRVRTTAHYRHR